MKILLINPPLTVFKGGTNPRIHLPLGLLSIAAQLERKGYEVQIFDALISAKLTKNNPSQWHFGESWEQISNTIRSIKPNVVGITSIFSSQSKNAKIVASLAKEVDKEIVTVVGGAHPSANPHDMLNDKNIDFVVIGEGEYLFLSLLDALRGQLDINSIHGLCSHNRGIKIENFIPEKINNLDELSFPAYHLYDMERYFFLQNRGFSARKVAKGKREVSIVTSRGCPYNCVFCCIHSVMGRVWRFHSAEYVLGHIEYLKENYKIDFIHFEDDNFSLSRQRFEAILNGFSARKISIKWEVANGLRADDLDETLIKKAIDNGCHNIQIAVESGVQRVLSEVIEKKLSLSSVLNVAKICKKLDIQLYGYYVIGIPGETLEDIKQTLLFAKKMLLAYFMIPKISLAAPIWGSRLYDICKDKGYLVKDITPERLGIAYDPQGKGLIKTDEFSPDDLKKALSRYNKLFIIIIIINALRSPRKFILYFSILMRNKFLFRQLFLNR